MSRAYNLLLSFFLLCATLQATAQSTDSTVSHNKIQFKISANYNSNLNYYGRTDSLRNQSFFPMAELWLTPQFYVNAAPVFVSNKAQRFAYAGTVTTIGYQKVSTHWIKSLYLLKPFYQQNVQLVQSALKAQTGASFSYLNKIINLTAGGDVKFSSRIDFGATAGIDHLIKFQKGTTVFVLDPSLYAYAGTQQFSRTYLQKTGGTLLTPPRQQQVTEQGQKFVILSYEASLPVVIVKNKNQLLFTPAYVLPQNLITVAGRPDLSETGSNTFYATLTLKHTF